MRPLRDSKGKTIGFIKVARDITEHKLREQRLAELARLLNLSNDAIIVCDFDDRIRYWSHGAETLYGWSAQEAVGRIKHQLLQTLYLQPRAEVLAILERDNRWNGQLIQTTRTGARVVVNTRWALDRDPQGRPASILKTDNDITARKEAEAALRESEERFRAMAENIPQLAWMADDQGNPSWFNRRWTEYTGLTLEQLQAGGWKNVHNPAQFPAVFQGWNAAVASGKPWQDVFPLRHHSGRYGWFLSRAFPIRDDSGKITRWFGTTTDITELRETQEALHQAQEQLQQHAARLEKTVDERTAKLRETVEDLEAFSYSIAHDMRAPLRAMQGFSNMLQDEFGEQASSDAKEYLRRITASASRLDRLIQDVLNYSKVVRGELSLESVETEKFLHEIVESYPNLQSLRAEISIRGPMPPILANRAALTQVVSNLLGNAVKFVQPGVKPNVRIWAETRSNQQNGQPPETWVRVWFADNGIGIPANAQQRIFMMFQRLNPPSDYEGTGIGLSIVRKAVERMGGKVGVTSEPGKGSQFWIQLKQANPES
jgi:PAS domain S-box-containing protein